MRIKYILMKDFGPWKTGDVIDPEEVNGVVISMVLDETVFRLNPLLFSPVEAFDDPFADGVL